MNYLGILDTLLNIYVYIHIFFASDLFSFCPQSPNASRAACFPTLAFTRSSFCSKLTGPRAQTGTQTGGGPRRGVTAPLPTLTAMHPGWQGSPNGPIPLTKHGTAGEAGSKLCRKHWRGSWQRCESLGEVPCGMTRRSTEGKQSWKGSAGFSPIRLLISLLRQLREVQNNAKHIALQVKVKTSSFLLLACLFSLVPVCSHIVTYIFHKKLVSLEITLL